MNCGSRRCEAKRLPSPRVIKHDYRHSRSRRCTGKKNPLPRNAPRPDPGRAVMKHIVPFRLRIASRPRRFPARGRKIQRIKKKKRSGIRSIVLSDSPPARLLLRSSGRGASMNFHAVGAYVSRSYVVISDSETAKSSEHPGLTSARSAVPTLLIVL